MKKIILIIYCLLVSLIYADTKVGYIDSQIIMSEYEDVRQIQVELEKEQKRLQVIYEKKLTSYALKKLQEIPDIKIYGNPEKRGGVISFNIKGIHPQDLSQFLNEYNICLRVGHHCAQPLLKTLNETSTARVSFYIYNDFSDIDKLVDSINSTISYF